MKKCCRCYSEIHFYCCGCHLVPDRPALLVLRLRGSGSCSTKPLSSIAQPWHNDGTTHWEETHWLPHPPSLMTNVLCARQWSKTKNAILNQPLDDLDYPWFDLPQTLITMFVKPECFVVFFLLYSTISSHSTQFVSTNTTFISLFTLTEQVTPPVCY
jgi:hypothetical protein